MKKIVVFVVTIFVLLGLFIPVALASEESMQTLSETVSFSCSGSNRPGGPCEGVYLKKDHKWFKFEIPAFSDYELEMKCTIPDLKEDELCNEYSGHCEVLIEGVGMVGGLNPGFTKEPKTIKVKCTQCRRGGFYLTFYPTNCKVEVKYKNYGSCDNYCKATRGDDFYGQMIGADCECIKGAKKEKPKESEEPKKETVIKDKTKEIDISWLKGFFNWLDKKIQEMQKIREPETEKEQRSEDIKKSVTEKEEKSVTARELTKAYQDYIDAYNKYNELASEGRGDSPEAHQAYKEYKKAKERYEAIAGEEVEEKQEEMIKETEKEQEILGIIEPTESEKRKINENVRKIKDKCGNNKICVQAELAKMLVDENSETLLVWYDRIETTRGVTESIFDIVKAAVIDKDLKETLEASWSALSEEELQDYNDMVRESVERNMNPNLPRENFASIIKAKDGEEVEVRIKDEKYPEGYWYGDFVKYTAPNGQIYLIKANDPEGEFVPLNRVHKYREKSILERLGNLKSWWLRTLHGISKTEQESWDELSEARDEYERNSKGVRGVINEKIKEAIIEKGGYPASKLSEGLEAIGGFSEVQSFEMVAEAYVNMRNSGDSHEQAIKRIFEETESEFRASGAIRFISVQTDYDKDGRPNELIDILKAHYEKEKIRQSIRDRLGAEKKEEEDKE